jgi:hypothetical protein
MKVNFSLTAIKNGDGSMSVNGWPIGGAGRFSMEIAPSDEAAQNVFEGAKEKVFSLDINVEGQYAAGEAPVKESAPEEKKSEEVTTELETPSGTESLVESEIEFVINPEVEDPVADHPVDENGDITEDF